MFFKFKFIFFMNNGFNFFNFFINCLLYLFVIIVNILLSLDILNVFFSFKFFLLIGLLKVI